MVFVLLGHFPVVDDKHVSINRRNMPVGSAEDLKCTIDNLIGRYDLLVVAQDIM